MSHWTATDIPDLAGRTAVVTGANSGLGLITALELARHGAAVTMACRDPERGAAALASVREQAPDADVELARLDLADLSSVREFAGEWRGAHADLALLVNNAGVMAIPRRTTADGFEAQLGTNHLGHFALTGELLPALLAHPGARVVTVSSNAHKFGRMAFDDLQGEKKYGSWRAYGQSKLANLLFGLELQRQADAHHAALLSVMAHPGYASTNLSSVGPAMSGSSLMTRATALADRLFAQSAEMGALPQLYAATADGVHGGAYVGPDGIAEQRGHPKLTTTTSAARDTAAAARLWAESERLTGVTYDWSAAGR